MVTVPQRVYEPGEISEPPNSAALMEELRRIADAMIVYPETKGIAQGVPTALAVGTTRAVIQGYPNEYEGTEFEGKVDPVLGTIEIPRDGLYEVLGHVAGTHSTTTQNEAMALFLRSSINGDLDLAVYGIATNKQTAASLSFAITGAFVAGDVLSLGMFATTAIGTFTFVFATFEVTLRTLA